MGVMRKQIHKTKKTTSKIENIYNFILSGENHERKRIEIVKKFFHRKNGYEFTIMKMTHIYRIYENDDGTVIGILI